jgi:hypothetical protein
MLGGLGVVLVVLGERLFARVLRTVKGRRGSAMMMMEFQRGALLLN